MQTGGGISCKLRGSHEIRFQVTSAHLFSAQCSAKNMFRNERFRFGHNRHASLAVENKVCKMVSMKAARFRVVGFVIAAGALATALDARGASSPGEGLAERWCAQCHALEVNRVSPHSKAPPFPQLAAEPSVTPYSLRVLLRSPHASMPNLMLNPEQMDEITEYIMSLKPKP